MSDTAEMHFLDAVGTAEIAHDMLTYAAKDAAKLADAATELTGSILADDDALGHALALSARACRLEQKIKMMIERLDPMLAPAVAHERVLLNKQFS